MVNKTSFAERLQMILDYYGISATAFSMEINFNRSTISHLLSGRNKPSLEFVMKVLQKYPEVDLYWLIEGNGIFPSDQEKSEPLSEKLNSKTKEVLPENNKLFSDSNFDELKKNLPVDEIEQVVIFYRNGKFKVYLP